jgi:hypothetical protein
VERAAEGRDARAPSSRPLPGGAEMVGVTPELLLTVLACAMIGFAASVAGYHLPSLVPALRRVLERDRR